MNRRISHTIYLTLLIILFMQFTQVFSAEEEETKKDSFRKFSVGLGFELFFFNPKDVNDYMEAELSGYNITQGTKNIFMSIGLGINFLIHPIKMLGIKIGYDFLIAPKIIAIIGAENKFYALISGVANIMVYVYLPVGKKLSFVIGVGPDYYVSKFEDYHGFGFGGQAEAGLRISNRVEISIIGRFAKIKDIDIEDFTMDYIGAGLRTTVYF